MDRARILRVAGFTATALANAGGYRDVSTAWDSLRGRRGWNARLAAAWAALDVERLARAEAIAVLDDLNRARSEPELEEAARR